MSRAAGARRWIASGILIALWGTFITPPAEGGQAFDRSKNVVHVANLPFIRATDIDFDGRFAYVGQGGFTYPGIQIIDVSRKRPRIAGIIACPGDQNDVAALGDAILALGYMHGCGSALRTLVGGVRLVDVSDPTLPVFLSDISLPGGTHTITRYPGTPYIYGSTNGIYGPGVEYILDASDPKDLKLAAVHPVNAFGCHDVGFHITKGQKLGFCAGHSEVQIWDVSEPLAPTTIGRIIEPRTFFPHSAIASPDGNLLVVGDEAYVLHGCGDETYERMGALRFYDISDPTAPRLVGRFDPPRGTYQIGPPSPSNWCTAHNYNFIPGTRTLVSGWYTGGTSVIDLTDPGSPDEIAHFRAEDSAVWSSYWYRGRIYVSDYQRGLDVLRVKGL